MALSRKWLIPGVDFAIEHHADGSIAWPEPDPLSPYWVEGPALISFSGGRTSGLMLFLILWAHGGVLPANVHVVFANTGKEREETLRFIHNCATYWGVKIAWVEDCPQARGAKAADRYTLVGFNSASRAGEPFVRLIDAKQYLPNASMRYCTTELKIRPMKHFMLAQGYANWVNVIGLRADEPRRLARAVALNEEKKERWTTATPMARARHALADVAAFWRAQPFDLGLMPHEGNCDLCFLKGRGRLAQIIRDVPERADWWSAMERRAKTKSPTRTAAFRRDETYAELAASIAAQPQLALEPGDDDHEVECGLLCAADDEIEAGLAANRACGRRPGQ
jgi:3'-phosphoadenosine 5'-phosphosulfate sulfotransferase (PAPS reductase)/FAD synthetase